jgi:hypothetical protein
MKLHELLLITAVLLGGLTACSQQREPANADEQATQKPTLIMFYTDN